MSGSKLTSDVCREVKDLLIEGAKYTANGDLEKAVKCYAKVLDLESQKPEPYLLLARCLYQVGLKRNDIFGAQGEDEELEESEDEEDDEDMSDGQDSSADEGQSEARPLNSHLYQFDHEEEEELDGQVQPNIRPEEAIEEAHTAAADEGTDDDGSEDDISPAEGFENYMQGDLFENALELLYRARIMYMESSKASEDMSKGFQQKLMEIYELLGDIDQELEDFAQAVRDYEEAIRMCQAASSQNSNERVISIYMKLAEALRWTDSANDDSITTEQQKSYLVKIKRLLKARLKSHEASDPEEDELRLQKINEDLKALKDNRQEAAFDKNTMMQAILKQALDATKQGQVNDLSKMVKKNRKKPL